MERMPHGHLLTDPSFPLCKKRSNPRNVLEWPWPLAPEGTESCVDMDGSVDELIESN